MRNVVLFDLDSTLLQMDQDLFLKSYFKAIAKFSLKLGYDPEEFMRLFNIAAFSIIKNDGSKTNEDVFWDIINEKYPNVEELKQKFEDFYKTDFKELEVLITKSSVSNDIIKELKSKGYTIILATNPVFPRICTYERMRWAGLSIDDFLDITTYEDSTFCKPNRKYYMELLNRNNIDPKNCIMVGNDVDDDFLDLPEEIEKVLITDYLINNDNKVIDIPSYTLNEFLKLVRERY